MALAMIELVDENGSIVYLNLDDIMAIVRVPEADADSTTEPVEDTPIMSRVILRGGFPAMVYGTPEEIVANFQAETPPSE